MEKLIKLFKTFEISISNQLFKLFCLSVLVSFFEILVIGGLIPFFNLLLDFEGLVIRIKNIIHQYNFSVSEYVYDNLAIILMITYGALIVLSTFFRLFLLKKQNFFTYNTSKIFSFKIYEGFVNSSYNSFRNKDSGLLISNLSLKINNLISSVLIPIPLLISSTLNGLFIIIVLLFINYESLIAAILISVISYFIMSKLIMYRVKENSKIISTTNDNIINILKESIDAFREIKIFNLQQFFKNTYNYQENKYRNTQEVNSYFATFPRFYLEGVGILTVLIVSFIIFSSNSDIQKSVELTIVFSVAFLKLVPQFQTFYNSFIGFKSSTNIIMDLVDYHKDNLKNKKHQLYNFKDLGDTIIRFKDFYFSYNENNPIVLKNINLDIKIKEHIFIRGVSGSGKSTLVDLIIGFLDNQKNIYYNSGFKDLIFSKNLFSYTTQSPSILRGSVVKNITQKNLNDLTKIERKKIDKILKICDLHEWSNKINNQVDVKIEESGKNISGGQKQRLAIARCLYKDSHVYIFDEATGSLNVESRLKIVDSMLKYLSDKTVIYISHNLDEKKFFKNTLELKNNQLYEK